MGILDSPDPIFETHTDVPGRLTSLPDAQKVGAREFNNLRTFANEVKALVMDASKGNTALDTRVTETESRATTLEQHTRGNVNVFEWIPSNYHAGIEIGTSSVDVGGWIQDAADTVVAAGRGTVIVPRGLYRVEQMIDLTRAPSADVALVGMNAMLSCTAASTIEALIKTARTGSQAPYRYHAEFRGLRLNGNSKAFYGIRAAMDVGSEVVSIVQCYVEGCTIGLDLEAVMESRIADLVLYGNTTGLRLRPDVTGVAGGGNANSFDGVKITGGQVGIVIYQDHDVLPFHNNTFAGTLVQGVSVAGIVLAGGMNYNQHFTGGHFESGLVPTGTGSVQVGDFGAERTITVNKADLVLLSAEARLDSFSPDSIYAAAHADVEGARSSKLPRLGTAGGSIGGNEGTQYATLGVFDTRDTTLDLVTIEARHGSPHTREFYRSTVAIEEIPIVANPGANEVSAHVEIHLPATAVDEVDATLGDVKAITFDASVGNATTNSYRRAFANQTTTGEIVYASAVLKSDTDTTVIAAITGDAGLLAVPVTLRAGKWTYLRAASSRAAGNVWEWLAIYPESNDGPVVRIARPYAANVADPVDAATLFNGGAFL